MSLSTIIEHFHTIRVTRITSRQKSKLLWFMERRQVCSRSVYRALAFHYVTNKKKQHHYILVFCVRIDPMSFFFNRPQLFLFDRSFVFCVYILFCLLKSSIQKPKRTQYDHRYCVCFLFDIKLLSIPNLEPLSFVLILNRCLDDSFGKQKVIELTKNCSESNHSFSR